MRKVILLFFLLISHSVQAQFPGWLWAKSFNGIGSDQCESSVTDHSGNLLSTGVFRDVLDFDPGPGTYNLTCVGIYDIFVSKLDSNGNFVWAHSFGDLNAGNWGIAVAVDADDNCYVTGTFTGTIDFDPGPGVFSLTGSASIYVLKLDAGGNFVWAVALGQAPSYGVGLSILTDADQHIYVTGSVNGTIDFDPGPGVFNLNGSMAFPYNTFMLKLDSASNFIWAIKMNGSMLQYGNAPVALDTSGNSYFIGYFDGTLDFDHGTGVYNLTAAGAHDVFIIKTDSSGNFVWAKQFGGTGNDVGYSVSVDPVGNIYAYGDFNATVDFDPGPSTFNLVSTGYEDVFITKLNTNGDHIWAESFGGNYYPVRPFAMAADLNGSIYMSGYFADTVDFDPGPAVSYMYSVTTMSFYLIKVDSTGNLEWSISVLVDGNLAMMDISIDVSNNVYLTGSFTVDSICLGPYTLYNAAPVFAMDIYLAKFGTYITALPEPADDNNFSIFPNPAGDMLSFESENAVLEAIITDASGKMIEKITCPQQVINVTHLAKGMYFISLHFPGNKVFTRKFLK